MVRLLAFMLLMAAGPTAVAQDRPRSGSPATRPARAGSAAAAAREGVRRTRAVVRDAPKVRASASGRRPIEQVLTERVPLVHFIDTPLEQVLQWVADYSGAMVYVRWPVLAQAGIARDTPITIKARNKRLDLILRVVLSQAGERPRVRLAFEASGELLVVSTQADLGDEMVTRAYLVADVTQSIPDCTGPHVAGGGAKKMVETVYFTHLDRSVVAMGWTGLSSDPTDYGDIPFAGAETQDPRLRDLMDMIVYSIEPDSWLVNQRGGRGTIFPVRGHLVIRNSRHVHDLIAGLLQRQGIDPRAIKRHSGRKAPQAARPAPRESETKR